MSKPFITSYGDGGPIGVSGGVSEVFYAIRDVINEFIPLPRIGALPIPSRMKLPSIRLRPMTTLFSSLSRSSLGSQAVSSMKPLTFEQLRQDAGYVLYEKILPNSIMTPSHLRIPTVHDRAYIYMNNVSGF